MVNGITWIVCGPIIGLITLGLIPSPWANKAVKVMQRLALLMTALATGTATLAALLTAINGKQEVLVHFWGSHVLSTGIYFDSLTAVMLLLVSFIGMIITGFASQYLQGDVNHGRFLRWTCFTLGAVQTAIVSGNLLQFTLAWMVTSYGVHQLLIHFRDRPVAKLAANKKFLISRCGDIFLITALVMIYKVYGTFEYAAIFSQISEFSSESAREGIHGWIGVCLVLGAATKSAQFPFHTWLPETMETPTPVSALMHAGIINAGGFLIIRLSPLFSLAPVALDMLALLGAITAILGSTVMLTQPSIKRSLAYSTIAQMGMMMMQCGLGCFAAALLHIVTHSLYKSYAFLSTGTVLEVAARSQWKLPAKGGLALVSGLVSSVAMAAIIVVATFWFAGRLELQQLSHWPLGLVLILSVTHLIWNAFLINQRQVTYRALIAAFLSCVVYTLGWLASESILGASAAMVEVPFGWTHYFTAAFVAISFLTVFALQIWVQNHSTSHLARWLYMQAINEFYLDIAAHRIAAMIFRNGKSTAT